MPLPTLRPIIVLSDFARSSSAEKKNYVNAEIFMLLNQMRAKACQKSGPGVWPTAGKLFSDLIFGYFPSKGK